MTDYRSIERQLTEALGLARRPVAVAFLKAPPAGIAKFEGVMPSGCSFWRLAADGRTFYTVPATTTTAPSGATRITSPCRPIARRSWSRLCRSWPRSGT